MPLGAFKAGMLGAAGSGGDTENYVLLAEYTYSASGIDLVSFENISQDYKNLVVEGSIFNTWTGGSYQVSTFVNATSIPSGTDYKYHSTYMPESGSSWTNRDVTGDRWWDYSCFSAYVGTEDETYGDASGFTMWFPDYTHDAAWPEGKGMNMICNFHAQSTTSAQKQYKGFSAGYKQIYAAIETISFYSGMYFGPKSWLRLYGLSEA